MEAAASNQRHEMDRDADIAMAKRVLRKIDWRLIPVLFVTYTLNFMDKTILSSASVFGLSANTVSRRDGLAT
jgi:hypothetical protein